MKVMVIVKATDDSEAGVMPSEQLLTEMGKYNEELIKAGVMLAGEGLHPSSRGARVHFSGKNRTVIDGPFAETKELVAGYWLWNVKSMEDAIEWVKRCPNPMNEASDIEIRRVFEPEDFAEIDPNGDIVASEKKLADDLAKNFDAPRVEKGRELLIAGLNQGYTHETRVKIPQQWERFAPQIGKIPGQIGDVAYGVCWKNQPSCDFDYLSGVEVKNTSGLPAGTSHIRIPAQRYAVFTHKGHVSEIPRLMEHICSKGVSQSGFQLVQDAPIFERYSEAFDPETGKGGMEVWVPIKS